MTQDYILFIHGVNERSPNYADKLFQGIQRQLGGLALRKIALSWGNVDEPEEQGLLNVYKSSPYWPYFWSRFIREKQILHFTGDTALYISRATGAKVVNALWQEVSQGLQDCLPGDRLHLVAHSLGSIIFFDILFSSRWDDPSMPGHDSAMALRTIFWGSGPHYLRLSSIATMGSPLGVFSLIDVDRGGTNPTLSAASSHDITPCMEALLEQLHLQRNGAKLPWSNFAHPGDLIASPLAELIPLLIRNADRTLAVEDTLIQSKCNFLLNPIGQTPLVLANAISAHSSYWSSSQVMHKIAQIIQQAQGPAHTSPVQARADVPVLMRRSRLFGRLRRG